MANQTKANPIKIAFYGPAGSGKDYVASKVQSLLYPEAKRFAFADKLKKIVNELLGLSGDVLEQSIKSEDFKNKTFVDLDTLETFNLKEIPSSPFVHERFGLTSHVLFEDQERYSVPGPFVIYSADTLFELMQRSSGILVIPNIVQCWEYESIIYPFGYNQAQKDLKYYRRLMSYRELLVWVGTYCMQNMLGKRCLVNAMMNDHEFKEQLHSGGAIITDLRFPHEYEACKSHGFMIVEVEAETNDVSVSNVAESYYSKFVPEFVFHNSRDTKKFTEEIDRLKAYIESR